MVLEDMVFKENILPFRAIVSAAKDVRTGKTTVYKYAGTFKTEMNMIFEPINEEKAKRFERYKNTDARRIGIKLLSEFVPVVEASYVTAVSAFKITGWFTEDIELARKVIPLVTPERIKELCEKFPELQGDRFISAVSSTPFLDVGDVCAGVRDGIVYVKFWKDKKPCVYEIKRLPPGNENEDAVINAVADTLKKDAEDIIHKVDI